MAKLSNERLNELLIKVLEERVQASVEQLHNRLAQELYRRHPRHYDWHEPEPEVTVQDVLNEGLGVGISQEVLTEWGVRPRQPWQHFARRPHAGDPQPRYDFECYQCGRPVAHDNGWWKDHAGRTACDAALLPQDMIDHDEYYDNHRPKPIHGEEEDE